MDTLLWIVPLGILTFLWSLNEFLRGSSKELISGVLALLMFVTCAAAFFFAGWKDGVVALVLAFVFASLSRPFALAVARKLIPYPDLGVERYQQAKLEQTVRDFGSEGYFQRRDKEERAEQTHRDRTVEEAARESSVGAVLQEFSADERDLGALYDRMEIRTLPPQHRELVLGNAALIEFFLENSTPKELAGKYLRDLNGQDAHLLLSLWASSNPAGDRPK